jgi:hypothetical protein
VAARAVDRHAHDRLAEAVALPDEPDGVVRRQSAAGALIDDVVGHLPRPVDHLPESMRLLEDERHDPLRPRDGRDPG